MSSLSSEASLIVATFQSLAVGDVTNAIRAADLESGDVLSASGIAELPQRQHLSGDTYSPSAAFEHAGYARFGERRSVSEWREAGRCDVNRDSCGCVEPSHSRDCCPPPFCPTPPIPNPHPGCDDSPIQPPWKVVPWTDRYARSIAMLQQIKRVAESSDMGNDSQASRGQMLDVVI